MAFMMDNEFHEMLTLVERPARYLGNEHNAVHKDLSGIDVKIALAFPDVYEIGMSHLGIQILYDILNHADYIAAERVFAPWTDMEKMLIERDIPLFSLESRLPLNEFDIIGFSLQYELSYTNVLNMMKRGGIPILSKDRDADAPLVIGGGPCAFNPEPVADFFDLFLIGDAEEAILEIADTFREWKSGNKKAGKHGLLQAMSRIEGVYVPSFFDVRYRSDGTIGEIRPAFSSYAGVMKRIVPDLNRAAYPHRPLVPFMEIVHDRINLEIARGCTRGCRFCQAGMIYRPLRERSPELLLDIAEKSLLSSGYEDLSLLSLSSGDYSCINWLLTELMDRHAHRRTAISFPSTRVDAMTPRLLSEIKRVRKTGFTLAPEAGSERLRRFINKGITEEEILRAAEHVFEAGWTSIKLYFMLGLPSETDEDIIAIAELSGKILKAARRFRGRKVTVSLSTFIPKSHTPFQWESQNSTIEIQRRLLLARRELTRKGISFKSQSPEMSMLEGVFARGDRKLASVIERASELGCHFDGWGEELRFDLWQKAFEECNIDAQFYLRERQPDEFLPWEHIQSGISMDYLKREYRSALGLEQRQDCRSGVCDSCGVCDFNKVSNITSEIRTEHKNISTRSVAGAARSRFRLIYLKCGEARLLGHLELAGLFYRATRRAGISVRFSEGFHPSPRIIFSPPIPVGMESRQEYVDIETEGAHDCLEIMTGLNMELPSGIRIEDIRIIPNELPSVTASVARCLYEISIDNLSVLHIRSAVMDFMDKDEYFVEKAHSGKKVNAKSLVEDIKARDNMIFLALRVSNTAALKPLELVRKILEPYISETTGIRVMKTHTVLCD